MTHIGAKAQPMAPTQPATAAAATVASDAAPRMSPVALAHALCALSDGAPLPPCAEMPLAMAPPAAPQVSVDARTQQAMASFEAEIGQMCASWERWAAAEDVANQDRLRQHKAAVPSAGAPLLAHVTDGGLHVFMRLRLENTQSGAAELRRLAQRSIAAQDAHLKAQQAQHDAALATAQKMQRWMGVAHSLTAATHGIAMATGCAVGAALAVGAATPVATAGALGLTLVTALACGLSLSGRASGTWLQVAAVADMAALSGLLLMTGAQANPALGPMLIVTQLIDGLASVGHQALEGHFDTRVHTAQAKAQQARVLGQLHQRGYEACMDAVQRMGQSHGRALSIIHAMLRSSQQVSLLQSRNLRK